MRGARPAPRPGSATPGQPASDSIPTSTPALCRREQRLQAGRRRAVGERAGCRASRSARPRPASSGTRARPSAFPRPSGAGSRATSTVRCGSTLAGGARPSRLGTRYSRPTGVMVLRASASERRPSRHRRRDDHVDALGAQQVDQRDQRQADQRRRVVALDPLEQRDAERFRPHAAGAVVRLLARAGSRRSGSRRARETRWSRPTSTLLAAAARGIAAARRPVRKTTVCPESAAQLRRGPLEVAGLADRRRRAGRRPGRSR